MIPRFLFILFCLYGSCACAQQGTWVWMKGDSVPDSHGVYGPVGVAGANFVPPARACCASWADTAGNFWIFGGQAASNNQTVHLTDLWKFDPSSGMWAYMGDIPSYFPDIYYGGTVSPMQSWITRENELWFLCSSGEMVSYSPDLDMWTYRGSSRQFHPGNKGVTDFNNSPGRRSFGNACWTDSLDNLWFFGDRLTPATFGTPSGVMNDAWKYDIGDGTWTWMSGSANMGSPGTAGQVGIASVNNNPSARGTNFSWKDSDDNFWLVGGTTNLSLTPIFSDVWMFNPHSLEWTLKRAGTQGVYSYGNRCQPDPLNRQGARYGNSAVWKVNEGLIVNYGGYFNDVWAFLPHLCQWIKLNDSLPANYGIRGVPNSLNYPPKRNLPASFKDRTGRLWMFGGARGIYQFAPKDTTQYYNDMWVYNIDSACLGPYFNSQPLEANTSINRANCDSTCSTVIQATGINGIPAYTYRWLPANDPSYPLQSVCPGQYIVQITDNAGITEADTVVILAGTTPVAPLNASNNPICASDSAVICAPSAFSSYAWTGGATSQCITTSLAGNYSVTVTDNNGCSAVSPPLSLSVYPVSAVSISVSGDTLSAYNAPSYRWYLDGNAIAGATSPTFIATGGGIYTVETIDSNGCKAVSSGIVISGLSNAQDESVQITISPNPTSDKLIVESRLSLQKINIYTLSGAIVESRNVAGIGASGRFEIMVGAFPKGAYLIEVITSEGIIRQRWIKL